MSSEGILSVAFVKVADYGRNLLKLVDHPDVAYMLLCFGSNYFFRSNVTCISMTSSFLFFFTLVYYIESQDSQSIDNRNETLTAKKNFLATNERLYQHIFSTYNANLPPIYTKGRRNATDFDHFESTILVTLMYAKLMEVSAPRQLMTVIFEYAMIWEDERLAWDPKEFDGIEHIYVLRNNVWIPEITPFDSMEVVDTRPDYKQHVPIDYRGLASFYTSVVTSVVCPIDVTIFPFDHQNCSLKLLSYSFYRHEIRLQNAIFEDLDISSVGNDEWEVTNILSCNDQLNSSNSEAVQLNEFTFYMKRNPNYYIALIIIPSFILTFLCVAGLFSSSLIVDDLDKFCMGLTTIMSTTVMIGIVAENIPKTKVIPNLIVYVTTNLIIVGTAILIIIVLPKISQLFVWICRCCKRRCALRHCGMPMGIINVALLLIFEGYVIKNLVDLVGAAIS